MSGKHSVKRERRWPRRILIAVNVIVALAIVGTASAFGYVEYRLGQVKRVAVPGLAPTNVTNDSTSQSKKVKGESVAPFTTLIIGSDTRSLGKADNAAYGNTAEDPGQRSDSIILLRVNPDAHALSILSIPRDTLEPIPGMGVTRVNAAFNTGNAGLLVKVLNQDFDIQVNHVVEFNFATFEDIANSIGGVYQYFPTPALDINSGLNIPKAGCVLLTGATALAFARSREYQYYLDGEWHYQQFPESDLGRIQRQQDFVKLAAKKAQQIAPTDPLKLNKLIGSLTGDVTLDSSFSNSLILDLVKDFRNANLSELPEYTYPTTNVPNAGTLNPDIPLGKQTIQQWLSVGTPAPTTVSRQTATPSTTAPTTKATTAKSPTAKPTTSTTAPTPPTTAVRPSSVAIDVVNGSGKTGQAALASTALRNLGYDTTTGADGEFDHSQTVIEYAPDSLAAAKQLKSQVSGTAVLTESTALTASPYNLEVLTGDNFTGVSATPGSATAGSSSTSGSSTTGSSSTTEAPTTTTTLPQLTDPAQVGSATVQADSSSFYQGRYIPPGRVPGQIPPSCPS